MHDLKKKRENDTGPYFRWGGGGGGGGGPGPPRKGKDGGGVGGGHSPPEICSESEDFIFSFYSSLPLIFA